MGSIISTIIRVPTCYAFPAYMTFKSVRTNNTQATSAWLQFWAVLGMLLTIEFLLTIPMFWMPGYNLIFTAVMIAMAWPQSTLTPRLFRFMAPKISQYEPFVDEKLKIVMEQANGYYPKVQPFVTRADQLLRKLEGTSATATKRE